MYAPLRTVSETWMYYFKVEMLDQNERHGMVKETSSFAVMPRHQVVESTLGLTKCAESIAWTSCSGFDLQPGVQDGLQPT